MILYPAIDLKDGKCVRLVRGEMSSATVYAENPAEQARAFEQMGFSWIHLVDLNGAVEGRSVNAQAVEAILSRVAVPVQLGGGIRDMAAVEHWLERGVSRIILGTAAVRSPEMLKAAAQAFPGRIAVGLDARAGNVAVEGWAQSAAVTAAEMALRAQDAGACAIVYTDIARDGTGLGLNVDETLELAESVSIPVIASGGVSGLADVAALMGARDGCDNIAGVVIGRALYDGRIDPARALALARGEA
jgi:phosphoribosylformimino-5-aminoimidazole carboxamide ribotide isomerase